MRPSPLPKSITLPLRPFNNLRTLEICSCVAGTNGKHIFRSAGFTNEKHTVVSPIKDAPKILVNTIPAFDEFFSLLLFELMLSMSVSILDGMVWRS